MALAHRAHSITYKCYPSHKLIAEEAEVSVATVKRCLDKLVELKIVSIEARNRPEDRGRTSNIYRLNVQVDYHQPDGSVVKERPPAQNELPPAQNELSPSSSGELPRTLKKNYPSRAKALSGSSATRIVTDPKQLQSFRILCVQWATGGLKWSASDAGIEFERFVDNATAHDRQYKDWLAAWRNWCRSPYCKTTAPKDDLRDYLKGPMRG